MPIVPAAPPAGAHYGPPPVPTIQAEGWRVVTCPSPWLRRPLCTVGLGDTFLAGTLLVLPQTGEEAAVAAAATVETLCAVTGDEE
jgi:sugar/nucleoside kinase (ribokinase family)